ncbi:MAG: insulinase family protein [Opitutaceae bacterium]|nr:insulinase family protein [Opitutaceae bacterium]
MSRPLSLLLATAAFAAGFSCSGSAQPASPPPTDITFVRELAGIREFHVASNGLRVLLVRNTSAPVVTVMTTYHVGSRNEVVGTTGATHLLEHLFFKGTERFNRDRGTSLDQLLDRVGAENNATTSYDRTNYYVDAPSDQLPLVCDLLADHLRHLRLREEDRAPEMTVVRNEFENGENSPWMALNKAIWASAYTAHPYHNQVIGWRSDIENVPIGKLRAFRHLLLARQLHAYPGGRLHRGRRPRGGASALRRPPARAASDSRTLHRRARAGGPRRTVVHRAGEPGVVGVASTP